MDRTGYREFLHGIYEKLRVDRTVEPGEALFYDLSDGARGRIDTVRRFNITPFITGVRGFNNRAFNTRQEFWKYWMRIGLRRVAPSVWV